jgi:hypothetical protein
MKVRFMTSGVVSLSGQRTEEERATIEQKHTERDTKNLFGADA